MWSSREAARPLVVHGDLLLAQTEPARAGVMGLAVLDRGDGSLRWTMDLALPEGVIGRVAGGRGTKLGAWAAVRQAQIHVGWEHLERWARPHQLLLFCRRRAQRHLPGTTEMGTGYGIHPGAQCSPHMSLVADAGDWVSLNGDLPVNEQHDTAYDSVSNVIFSGNQDTGTGHQAVLNNPTWTTFGQGDGADVVVAESHPTGGLCTGTPPCSTRYWAFPDDVATRRNIYDSANTLRSSTAPALIPLGGADSPIGQFTTPLALNAADPTRVVAGAANGVYESMDELDTASRISIEIVNAEGGAPIAYGTAGNPDALYYAFEDRVFVRTTAAAPPAATDPGGADFITGVAIDPDDANHAFAVDSDQVFRTTDAGAAWADVTGDLGIFLPGTLRSIAYVARAAGDAIAVGTDRGVYVAFASDGFATWALLGAGLPNAPVYELDDDPADDLLVAGTLGRGAWTLSPVLAAEPVLTVTTAGTGTGTVTSAPPGIDCGADCSEPYPQGTLVTLTATADSGSLFSGWSDGGCGGTGNCALTLDSDNVVTATFEPSCAAATLGCGQSISASLADPGATQQIDSYSCSSFDYSGKEMLYDFTSPVVGQVTVELSGTALDLDLFVLSSGGCDGDNCIDSSQNLGTDETVAFAVTFGTTYLLSVDDFDGGGGSFTISLDCSGPIFADGFESGDMSNWTSSLP